MARGLILCLLALGAHSAGWAWTVETPAGHTEPASQFFAAQGSVSLAQATAMAVQRYPGRVVRAETADRGGRREHRIRILGADGRVRTVRIDANTGRFL